MASEPGVARLAIDIGGTFTDLAWYDLETGELRVEKTLTTVSDLSVGVLDAIRLAAVPHRRIDAFVHGGTTVINALTERKGARTALVTTRGFRDVLEIGRGNWPDLYNLVARKPEPFVPRRLSFELGGRLDARRRELEPLDLAALDEVAGRCRALGVEAVAIQLLHSWADPAHERAAAERLRELL